MSDKTNYSQISSKSGGSSTDLGPYANSKRTSYSKSKAVIPAEGTSMPASEGFFKSTIQDAAKTAYKNVVDPTIRSFLWDFFQSIFGSFIWGKSAPGHYDPVKTPYRNISEGRGPINKTSFEISTTSDSKSTQLTKEDHMLQTYEKCHKATEDEVLTILKNLYRDVRLKGHCTLARYYELFGESFGFQDEMFGWTELNNQTCYPRQYADGWHLIMPPFQNL